jgi:hypothetical protein
MAANIDDRRRELIDLRSRDEKALLRIWREAGGVPPGTKTEGEIDFENVIIPAILETEFPK